MLSAQAVVPSHCQEKPVKPKLFDLNELRETYENEFGVFFQAAAARVAKLYGWSAEKTRVNALETFRALVCKGCVAGDGLDLSIPPELDLVWHQLLLETKAYRHFCEHVVGKFLEHTTETMDDTLEEKQARVDRNIAVYLNLFRGYPEWELEKEVVEVPGPRRSARLGKRSRPQYEEKSVEPQTFQIFVKTLTGKTVTVVASPHLKCGDLKYMFWLKDRDVAPTFQNLVFAGQRLDDERLLSYYNIRKESTLHLILSLRGC